MEKEIEALKKIAGELIAVSVFIENLICVTKIDAALELIQEAINILKK